MQPAEKIFRLLSDFWTSMPEEDREALSAQWQGITERRIDLQLGAEGLDRSKGILSAPVQVDGYNVPLVFNDSTSLDETRSGFEYGYSINPTIEEAASLRDRVGSSATKVLESGTDYTVELGKIFFKVKPPTYLMAPTVKHNLELVWRNFGFLIDLYESNSASYKRKVQGVWFALFGGPNLDNIQLGMSALLNLPFAKPGTVKSKKVLKDGSVDIVVDDFLVNVPVTLADRINVEIGDVLTGYRAVVDAVTVEDFIVNPDFAARAGIRHLLQYFTFLVTVDDDVVLDLIGPLGSLDTLFSGAVPYIEKAKPAYTDFFLDVLVELSDVWDIATTSEPRVIQIRMPSDLAYNPVNVHYGIDGNEVVLGSFDELAYIASEGDERLDLGNDAVAFKEDMYIVDQPSGGGDGAILYDSTDYD